MTSFIPARANLLVLRFFFVVVTRRWNLRGLFADFARTFRKLSAKFPRNWRENRTFLKYNRWTVTYEITSNSLFHKTEATGIIHNSIYSVNCVCIACSSDNMTGFGSPKYSDERILLQIFLHNAFHFAFRQKSQKLILHQIHDIYPLIKFIHKSWIIIGKLHVVCDAFKAIFLNIKSNL